MSKRGLKLWEISQELLEADVHEELDGILRLAEEGYEGFPELREKIRGYLQEDAAWRVALKRHFAKGAPARVKAFLDSVS